MTASICFRIHFLPFWVNVDGYAAFAAGAKLAPHERADFCVGKVTRRE
jgi:hypothetical protein